MMVFNLPKFGSPWNYLGFRWNKGVGCVQKGESQTMVFSSGKKNDMPLAFEIAKSWIQKLMIFRDFLGLSFNVSSWHYTSTKNCSAQSGDNAINLMGGSWAKETTPPHHYLRLNWGCKHARCLSLVRKIVSKWVMFHCHDLSWLMVRLELGNLGKAGMTSFYPAARYFLTWLCRSNIRRNLQSYFGAGQLQGCHQQKCKWNPAYFKISSSVQVDEVQLSIFGGRSCW